MANKQENSILLSVIIPCYNCAPVITRCLGSIDYPDCEIIVINDGSTDDSAQVVQRYSETNPNVLLINKENGGVSSARNRGIEEAKGKYISFIDADDYIVRGGLKRIVEIAERCGADVVKFKNMSVSDNAELDTSNLADVPIQTDHTTGLGVLKRHDISDYIVWDGIYRRSVVVENNILFKTDLSLHEDDTFMGMLYCHVNVVIATDLHLYRYVRASSYSATHRPSIENRRKLIQSSLKAIRYRSQYVRQYHSEVMDLERLKYMRWVCYPRNAIEAKLSLKEYLEILKMFREEGVYPLDYAWIKVAGWDYAIKPYIKRLIQTFLANHPRIGWLLAKIYYGKPLVE